MPLRHFSAESAPLAARAVAWCRASQLDAELAAGGDPWSTRGLFARACHLLAPKTRATLARRLDHLVADASRPELVIRPVPIQRRAVLDARDALLVLRDRLRAVEPVGLRGIAATTQLLADGSGPIYNSGTGESLLEAAQRISGLLDPDADA